MCTRRGDDHEAFGAAAVRPCCLLEVTEAERTGSNSAATTLRRAPTPPRVPCAGALFSSDGRYLALWHADGVHGAVVPELALPSAAALTYARSGVSVYDAASEAKIVDFGGGEAAVQAVAFSPAASYLQVYHKPSGAEGEKNLKVCVRASSDAPRPRRAAHAARAPVCLAVIRAAYRRCSL